MEDLRESLTVVGSTHWGHLHSISMDAGGRLDREATTLWPSTYLLPQSSHTWIGLLLSSMNSRQSTMCTKDTELYKHQMH